MNAQDTYLRAVERKLRGIAPGHRNAVLDDLRGHLADALEEGRDADDVISALGTPAEIAARVRDEFGSDDATADRAWSVLQWTAVALAAVTGVIVAFILPSYTTASASSSGIDEPDMIETLYQAMGLGLALTALVPALVAAVPPVVPGRHRTTVSAIAAAVLTIISVLGGFTIGGFFLPVCLLAWAALVVRARGRGRGFGSISHVIGGVLTALPLVLIAASAIGGTISIAVWGWVAVSALAALAVLVGMRVRAAGWPLAAIGLVTVLAGLVTGDLLALAFVWIGGWWLTIGLAHAVAPGSRR